MSGQAQSRLTGAAAGEAEEAWDAAIAYLDVALEIEPAVAAIWSSRAFAKGQNHDLEGARDDYEHALELDPFDKIALTGAAILTVELDGDAAAGIARAERGAERYGDDPLYAYNLACTYGVALKVTPVGTPRAAEYREKALGHLRTALVGEAVDARWARIDPDLAALHGTDAFEALLRSTPGS